MRRVQRPHFHEESDVVHVTVATGLVVMHAIPSSISAKQADRKFLQFPFSEKAKVLIERNGVRGPPVSRAKKRQERPEGLTGNFYHAIWGVYRGVGRLGSGLNRRCFARHAQYSRFLCHVSYTHTYCIYTSASPTLQYFLRNSYSTIYSDNLQAPTFSSTSSRIRTRVSFQEGLFYTACSCRIYA